MDEQTENKNISLRGTILFLLSNQGSKSECRLPYLYINKDEMHKVFLKGDNPFENNLLLQFDGKMIEVTGYFKPNGTFLVEQIVVPGEAPAESDNQN